jgi:hypothetical protein
MGFITTVRSRPVEAVRHTSRTEYLTSIALDLPRRGINFDRESLRRIRKTIDRAAIAANASSSPLLDLHTGHTDISYPLTSYGAHYAYVDSLWNGEGFDFTGSPEYFLIEVSGFPMGLTADTLGSSYLFRGALFGTTERNSASARDIWTLWDNMTINEMTLMGFWEDDAPIGVAITNASVGDSESFGRVEATVFVAFGERALVTVASWADCPLEVQLSFDWDLLGFSDSSALRVTAPAIADMQRESQMSAPDEVFVVAANQGRILLLEK